MYNLFQAKAADPAAFLLDSCFVSRYSQFIVNQYEINEKVQIICQI